MLHSEAAYFDGAAVQHIADREERARLTHKRDSARQAVAEARRILTRPVTQGYGTIRQEAEDHISAALRLPGLYREFREFDR